MLKEKLQELKKLAPDNEVIVTLCDDNEVTIKRLPYAEGSIITLTFAGIPQPVFMHEDSFPQWEAIFQALVDGKRARVTHEGPIC